MLCGPRDDAVLRGPVRETRRGNARYRRVVLERHAAGQEQKQVCLPVWSVLGGARRPEGLQLRLWRE